MTPRASSQAGLTGSQLTRLQTLLEHKRSELNARLHSVMHRVGGEHPTLADPVDRAAESEEDAEELGVTEPDVLILSQIDRALTKLEKGTYGLSEVSGQPIGFDRLEALPWATQTASFQEEETRRRPRAGRASPPWSFNGRASCGVGLVQPRPFWIVDHVGNLAPRRPARPSFDLEVDVTGQTPALGRNHGKVHRLADCVLERHPQPFRVRGKVIIVDRRDELAGVRFFATASAGPPSCGLVA